MTADPARPCRDAPAGAGSRGATEAHVARAREIERALDLADEPTAQESRVDAIAAALAASGADLAALRAEVERLNAELSNARRRLYAYSAMIVVRPFKLYAIEGADPVPVPEPQSLDALLDELRDLSAACGSRRASAAARTPGGAPMTAGPDAGDSMARRGGVIPADEALRG